MRSPTFRRVVHCALAALLAGGAVLVGIYLPHVNHATVALILVLVIVGVAMRWGWTEALIASLAGGLGFDFYLLPPRGFALGSPEHLVTLLSFLCTAMTTGWLAARATRHRSLAEGRTMELARLRELDNALLEIDGLEAVLEQVAERVAQIFGAEGAAFFDQSSGRCFRAGAGAGRISDEQMKEAAFGGRSLFDWRSGVAVVAVPQSCSLGVAGLVLSQRQLDDIAERVGVAVTKARAAQQSLEAELLRRSENLKSAVLDALAHEIKGPFATVKVSVSTLLSGQPGNAEQQRELLEIASDELDRIEGWINDAIRMSSRAAEELQLDRAPHPIGDVVARALRGLGPQLDGREITVDVADSLPLAALDAEMIEKVIRQLVDNAAKYSPAGSPIRIGAEFTGAELVVHVADSGCGIPKDEQRRVFDKYYRGRARGSDTPGTGLGLASAKCIMEAHGGEIWVNSTPGSGSIFHISLPVPVEASHEQCENLERR